jgi:uncharacterized protein DUF1236
MRSKLLISTAALLAGVALASAQSMQGERRGGAAQGPQSQSSPKQSPSQEGKQSPSQEGMQQDRSQRGQDGQATGQAKPESGAQQGKQDQPQQRSQSQKQRDQTSGQGSQRQQGQTGQSQQGQTQPSQTQPSQSQPSQTQSGQAPQQGQTQQGQTTQQGQAGQAGGSANLTTEQRTRVRQTVLTGSNVPRVNNVNFTLSVGTTVPTRVRVVAVPPPLIEIYPEWRGHMYFVVGDQIIIVDRNHRIVAVISV